VFLMKLIPTGRRVRGKDVFLEEHASRRVSERGISVDKVISTIRRPSELYLERKYRPLLPHMKRYVAVRVKNDMVNIVVYDENENVIIITSWDMKPVDRYKRYKESKLEKNMWEKIK